MSTLAVCPRHLLPAFWGPSQEMFSRPGSPSCANVIQCSIIGPRMRLVSVYVLLRQNWWFQGSSELHFVKLGNHIVPQIDSISTPIEISLSSVVFFLLSCLLIVVAMHLEIS